MTVRVRGGRRWDSIFNRSPLWKVLFLIARSLLLTLKKENQSGGVLLDGSQRHHDRPPPGCASCRFPLIPPIGSYMISSDTSLTSSRTHRLPTLFICADTSVLETRKRVVEMCNGW
eukprot:749718-Hanusia_phi.AAC.1